MHHENSLAKIEASVKPVALPVNAHLTNAAGNGLRLTARARII